MSLIILPPVIKTEIYEKTMNNFPIFIVIAITALCIVLQDYFMTSDKGNTVGLICVTALPIIMFIGLIIYYLCF